MGRIGIGIGIGIGMEIVSTAALISHSTRHFFFDPDLDLDQPNFSFPDKRIKSATATFYGAIIVKNAVIQEQTTALEHFRYPHFYVNHVRR